MTVWSWRDIQFFVQARQLDDAKRPLTSDRRRQREQILDAFFTEASERAAGFEGDAERRRPAADTDMARLPDGADRELVAAALARGCHVFLTEDRGVLRADELFAPYGIRLWRTSELLEALLDSGELTERRSLCGVVPDNHGTTHLMRGVATDYAQRLAALADV